MRNFKFLRRNTWYNQNQQAISVCGTTTSTMLVYSGMDHALERVSTSTDLMSELIESARVLQERVDQLEEQTIRLRNDLNRV